MTRVISWAAMLIVFALFVFTQYGMREVRRSVNCHKHYTSVEQFEACTRGEQ
jgi:hypothetical protein